MTNLTIGSMAPNTFSIAFIFGLPVLILGWTQRSTARLWVAIYLASILSGTYVLNSDVSVIWILHLICCVVSTSLLITFTMLLSPLSTPVLQSILHRAQRDSENVGIDLKNAYVPPNEEDIKVDIIAVNGLGADPEWTWKAEDKSQSTSLAPSGKRYISWLKDLLPQDFPKARIMTFRQNTSYLIDAPVKSIEECGQQLLEEIRRIRIKERERKRPLLFVGHSFGGIVVKQALVLAEEESDGSEICQAAFGILFLGTPHSGAWPSALGKIIVDCAQWVGSTSQILDDLGYQSTKLGDLNTKFLDTYRGKYTCIYETKKTYMYGLLPLLVVNKESATVDGRGFALETDHSGLNKFASRDSFQYKAVVTHIQRLIHSHIPPEEEEIASCLDHLHRVDYKSLREQEDTKPLHGTCDWVQTYVDDFCRDIDRIPPTQETASPKTLILKGPPGTGKSVLARYILDYLESNKVEVRYFIFKRADDANSRAIPAMRTLIEQLLQRDHELYRHVRDHRESIKSQEPKTLDTLVRIFQDMMSDVRSKSIVIVIDALDECWDSPSNHNYWSGSEMRNRSRKNTSPTSASLKDLMKKLSLLDPAITGRFIITTRELKGLESTFPAHTVINLEDEGKVKKDVELYIDLEVEIFFKSLEDTRDGDLQEGHGKLKQEILLDMKEKAGTMFLWVYQLMRGLDDRTSSATGNIRQAMATLPTDMIEMYRELFKRKLMEGEKLEEAIRRKLPWILHAQPPLRINELRDALAIQDYKRQGLTLEEWKSRTLEEDLKRSFGYLVTIDRSTSQIRLWHQSLKDALERGYKPPPGIDFVQTICQTAEEEHAKIAAACLSYLAEVGHRMAPPTIEQFEENARRLFESFPFLGYAAERWPHHAQAAGGNVKTVSECFYELAKLEGMMEWAYRLFTQSTGEYLFGENMPILFKLAEFGVEELAMRHLQDHPSESVNLRSNLGEHILHSVAFAGCKNFFCMLLDKGKNEGVTIDMRDEVGQTALHFAAQNGQTEMIDCLISSGLREHIDEPGRDEWTPLHYAAHGQHLDTIAYLLKNGADATKEDYLGQTPLDHLLGVTAKEHQDEMFWQVVTSLRSSLEEVRVSYSEDPWQYIQLQDEAVLQSDDEGTEDVREELQKQITHTCVRATTW